VPRVWLTNVTVAPGTTAACASLTVPATVPVATWATAGAAKRSDTTIHPILQNEKDLRMTSPSPLASSFSVPAVNN
jgi:hypothetical protein